MKKFDLSEIPSDSDQDSDSESEKKLLDQTVDDENELGYVKKRTFSVELGNSSEDVKKLRGQITTNENEEVARVNFTTYKKY